MKKPLTTLLILCTALCSAQNKKQAAPNEQPKEQAVGVRFTYGPGENQWLNLYRAESSKPTPVYIWAHANSDGKTLPSANYIPKNIVDDCKKAGISVISWESVPQVKSREDLLTCNADLILVYEWILANAEKYNLDTENLFIGGQSRGTVVSWDFICKYHDKIRGAYLTQALPKGVWVYEAENPLTTITANNPPVALSYRTDMETDDGHSPKFGKRIVDKYAELGIGDRAILLLEQKNLNAQLVDFINKYKK